MLKKDKELLEEMVRKYGRTYLLNEMDNRTIRKTIDKYDKVGNRKIQLNRMKSALREIVEIEDGRINWIIDCEYNGVYVFDEATYLKYKDISSANKDLDMRHAIWTFNYENASWRNSVGDDIFPLTTNKEFAEALANAVKKGYEFKKKKRLWIKESLALVRNIDYSSPYVYLAERIKDFDFLDNDGYSGYVKYYAYVNEYMIIWYPANKVNISNTPYAFDITNGVWMNNKPEFIDEEKTKAKELADFISKISPRAEKRFKDWHTYLS